MTDNEIIKALEYKTKTGCELCDLKPDIYCQTCKVGLMKQALDLINRQQAEIERLQNAYKQCAWERDTFLDELKTAKSEAIKEFAKEIIHNILPKYLYGKEETALRIGFAISERANEMTEESK